jgi:EmrB/QacA subfamily drug resistance transporter
VVWLLRCSVLRETPMASAIHFKKLNCYERGTMAPSTDGKAGTDMSIAAQGSVQSNRYVILTVTTLASFLIPIMSSAVNVALPAISREYNMDVITLGWVTTSYILASAALLIPFGRLSDMYGRRNIFVLGLFVFTVGSILSILSTSGLMLLGSRAVQGIGGSAIFATSVAILTSVFPPDKRGNVLGLNTASVYLGLSLGPFIGGILTESAGWKSIFVMSSVLSVICVVGSLWKFREDETERTTGKFDLPGSIIYSLTLLLVMYGVSQLPETRAVYFIVAGFVAAAAFYRRETRAKHSLINLKVFRGNRGFTFSNLAALVNYSGTWAVSFMMSLYLQYAKGFDARTTGIILVTSPAVQAVFSPFFGRLSDRLEPRILASSGMATTAIGIAMLAFAGRDTSISYIVVGLAVLGFGFALFSAPNTNAIMSSAERQDYGLASALLSTMRQIGMMLSMGIVWTVLAIVVGRVEITPEHYGDLITSVRIAFLICASLCVTAIFFSMARGDIHGKPAVEPGKG